MALTAKLIRGVSLTSLDNEAIAKSLTTLTGVSARKLTEKKMWTEYTNCNSKPARVNYLPEQ